MVTLGCDPEIFLVNKKNEAVDASTIIKNRINVSEGYIDTDGIAIEIHPNYSGCREAIGKSISGLMSTLVNLKELKDYRLSFDEIIVMPPEVLKRISSESLALRCNPSYNAYTKQTNRVVIDPLKYPYRSAGGHIHMGFSDYENYNTKKNPILDKVHYDPITLTKLMDRLCGNTCVLINKSNDQVTRRKIYGMAGEFRLPEYGYEYRTPSNFWLRSYPLTSLVMGLCRMATSIFINLSEHLKVNVEDILTVVSDEDIIKAINNNDYSLALSNFEKIRKITFDNVDRCFGQIPLTKHNINLFMKFIEYGGIERYFPKDNLIAHWIKFKELIESVWKENMETKDRELINNNQDWSKLMAKYPVVFRYGWNYFLKNEFNRDAKEYRIN